MSKLNICDYKNVLPHIKLTSRNIYDEAKSQTLVFKDLRNEIVENRLRLPYFARPFYRFVYIENRIPSQNEFFNYYINRNSDYFSRARFSDDIMDGIMARAYRTLPSLVRDLYFNKYVEERISGYNTLYSLELDIVYGIDLLLYNDNIIHGVSLYTDTDIARRKRIKKENRHIYFDNVNYIELPIKFNKKSIVGDYFLYGEEEYNKLMHIITNEENKNTTDVSIPDNFE